tara:strand:- start:7074 stop:7733 length:660 start_codon:yes stop_codon:yes gene_type:complete
MNSILVQTDFDNTLTEGNVSELIHDEFGPDNWPEIYEKYKKGLITVEESNIYSFRYLNTKKQDLDNFVKKNVKFRDGFIEFYNHLMKNSLDLKIVSSGVDFYIFSALSSIGIDPKSIDIIAGKSTFDSKGIKIQYFDSVNHNISENFKGVHTALHKTLYSKIIYFGDSFTDLNSAKISDVIFATDKLKKYFNKSNIDHFPFENYFEVLEIFKEQNLTKF